MTRLLAVLVLALALTPPAMAARARHHRTVCVTYYDPASGPQQICGLPIRGR